MPLTGDRKRAVDRASQKRWRERLKADPERYESFKKKERRRIQLLQQQDPGYAERRRAQMRKRYHEDPTVRERAKQRQGTPEQRQRKRALKCLDSGLSAHLPDQITIVKERLERLLRHIEEM
jgi:hypothetical protein